MWYVVVHQTSNGILWNILLSDNQVNLLIFFFLCGPKHAVSPASHSWLKHMIQNDFGELCCSGIYRSLFVESTPLYGNPVVLVTEPV